MTTLAWAWLALAFVCALADWLAVATERRHLEYLAKPAVMVALIGLALALEPGSASSEVARPWFLGALVASLAGDVLLMLPRERFVGGLVAFLVAHLAYVVGLVAVAVTDGVVVGAVILGLLVVGAVLGSVGRRVVGAVQVGRPSLFVPVAAYMGIISAMVLVAFATGRPAAIAGASLFYASDAILAWDRFVDRRSWARTATHMSYHAGQLLLVLSLLG